MSTPSNDITYFCARVGGAELKFGVPFAMAQKVLESAKKNVKKKVSLETVIENGEKAIADAFSKGLHRHPKASKNIAPIVIACCLLSKDAQASPDARGFILEISNSVTPSWSADASNAVSDDTPSGEVKACAHYRAAAGRDEIEAILAGRATAAT